MATVLGRRRGASAVAVPSPPQAVDDVAETPEDTPVTIAVLANDSDPDGDPLTVVEVSPPAHGTAVVADTGAVEYTPESGLSRSPTASPTWWATNRG